MIVLLMVLGDVLQARHYLEELENLVSYHLKKLVDPNHLENRPRLQVEMDRLVEDQVAEAEDHHP
jgi:hypothetical protein